MTTLWQVLDTLVWNVFHRLSLVDFFDIALVAVIIYEILILTRETRGSAVLKGLMLILLVVAVSSFFGLKALNWLLMSVINNGAVVLVILFQPELRMALEQIGRGARIEKNHGESNESGQMVIDEIVRCLTNLSRRHVGALIVFERKTGLKDVIDSGITIDAAISAQLLENIFEPNTPLHDGAVIVRGDRVAAGACILNLTEGSGISHDLGTRHRAALGVSETTDAVVLIVSEETGIISMATGGKLSRHLDAKALREILGQLYAANGRRSILSMWRNRVQRTKEEAK